jgi:hypothetical protein
VTVLMILATSILKKRFYAFWLLSAWTAYIEQVDKYKWLPRRLLAPDNCLTRFDFLVCSATNT